ncbi:MAG: hypothetical protein ABW252_17830 [Polyangiales bacterium]
MPRIARRRASLAARRRTRVAGIALTEALIVATFMILLFAGVFFVHGVNDKKGDTLRQARYQAWAGTRPGCAGTLIGQASETAQVTYPLRGGAPVALSSRTEMACNEQPHPQDDMISVLEFATVNGFQGFLMPAVDTISGFLADAF